MHEGAVDRSYWWPLKSRTLITDDWRLRRGWWDGLDVAQDLILQCRCEPVQSS
jgi:hypothetical protein